MEKSSRGNYKIECQLAHDLINKLSVIVGHCDLLVEKTAEESPLKKRMLLIRDIAASMAAELGHLQCDLALRAVNEQKPSSA